MEVLITKFMPMFILIFLGYRMQFNNKITDDVIEGIKYIMFNMAIPSILFISYIKADIQMEYLLIFAAVFISGCIMMYIGKLLKNKFDHEYASWYLAGFENGMIGIPIFTALWGMEILPLLSLISLGNVIFIWFLYIPLIEYKNNSSVNIREYLSSMIKSPILLSIVIGLTLNITGIFNLIETNIFVVGTMNLMQTLANIATAMILLILGYSMKLNNINISQNFKYISIRLLGAIILALTSFFLINNFIGKIDPIFPKLFLGYFMLPPVYVLPVFINKERVNEVSFFSNSVLLYTFVSFAGIAIIALI